MKPVFETYAFILFVTEVERDAVLDMRDWEVFYLKDDSRTYYKLKINRNGQSLRVIAACIGEKGSVPAAALTMKGISCFHPQYVILSGIAAGIRFKHKEEQPQFGDVVLADSVWNIAKGKYTEASAADITSGEIGYIPRPSISSLDSDVMKMLMKLVKSPDNPVRVHVGTYLASNSVIASSHYLEKAILSSHHVAKALDMESYGVVYACDLAWSHRPTPIIVKGISDFADESKSDIHQKQAAANSCAFISYLLDRLPSNEDSVIRAPKERRKMRMGPMLRKLLDKPSAMHLFLTVCLTLSVVSIFTGNTLVSVLIISGMFTMLFAMTTALRSGNVERTELRAENSKMDKALQAFSEVREMLFAPVSFEDDWVKVESFTASGSIERCTYFGCRNLGNGRTAVVAANPLGEGISPELFRSSARNFFNILVDNSGSLSEALVRIGDELSTSRIAHLLCEAWVGIIDSSSSSMHFVNAGYPAPFIVRMDGSVDSLKEGTENSRLGLSTASFIESDISFSPGDRLVLCPREIEDCHNEENECFGRRRIKRFLSGGPFGSLSEISSGLKSYLTDFAADGLKDEGWAMMALEFKRSDSKSVFKGHIVDIPGRRVFDGVIEISEGRIKSLRESSDVAADSPYYLPGFIDSHVHIESSMLTPSEFARIASRQGTIGIVSDPHEIANVLGVAGVEYMLDNASKANFNFCFGAPSCVPSCGSDIETGGAVLDSKDVESLLKRDDIAYLSEMMNYPGVLASDPEVKAKIEAARKLGKPVDGHAPGLLGQDRTRYCAAGISTDHECTTIEEGLSCLENGMSVLIREGSAARNYDALAPLLSVNSSLTMFCTDDSHPGDFVNGHINRLVRRALADGYDLWDVLRTACVNPQEHYHLDWGLLREGDPATFIAVDSLSPSMRILSTYIRGEKPSVSEPERDHNYPNNFLAGPISEKDLKRASMSEMVSVIVAHDGELYTTCDVVRKDDTEYPWNEVQKIVVLNRYRKDVAPAVGYVRGFGITDGAMAASIAHDCHNVVAIGSSNAQIVRAVNQVVSMKGGIVALCGEKKMSCLELPIAGIMSPLDGNVVALRNQDALSTIAAAGCRMNSPFITMAFMALPVIPMLKITDKGVFSAETWSFVEN